MDVCNGKPLKMNDLVGFPIFLETPTWLSIFLLCKVDGQNFCKLFLKWFLHTKSTYFSKFMGCNSGWHHECKISRPWGRGWEESNQIFYRSQQKKNSTTNVNCFPEIARLKSPKKKDSLHWRPKVALKLHCQIWQCWLQLPPCDSVGNWYRLIFRSRRRSWTWAWRLDHVSHTHYHENESCAKSGIQHINNDSMIKIRCFRSLFSLNKHLRAQTIPMYPFPSDPLICVPNKPGRNCSFKRLGDFSNCISAVKRCEASWSCCLDYWSSSLFVRTRFQSQAVMAPIFEFHTPMYFCWNCWEEPSPQPPRLGLDWCQRGFLFQLGIPSFAFAMSVLLAVQSPPSAGIMVNKIFQYLILYPVIWKR